LFCVCFFNNYWKDGKENSCWQQNNVFMFAAGNYEAWQQETEYVHKQFADAEY